MAPVELLVKVTASGGLQLNVLLAVKAAVGLGKTRIGFENESLQFWNVCTSRTVYVPGTVKAFSGLVAVEVVPSPKSQALLCPAGEEVLVKLAGESTHTLSGAVKPVVITGIETALVRRSVSLQPLLLVTAKVTV